MDRFLLPIVGLVIVGVFVAGGLSGRPTTRKGGVGDTLQAKTISAKLIEVDTKGQYGVDVGLCNKQDAAVMAYHFETL